MPILPILPIACNPAVVDVCWTGVRGEYRRVWTDFPRTADPFGITLTPVQLNALGHLLVSMDIIDSFIDCQADTSTRQRACEFISRWMRGDNCSVGTDDQLTTYRLLPLRSIITERKIVEPFLSAAERVFCASEGKRNARDVQGLVRHLIDEGQAAAEMTILILGDNTNRGLNNFLQRIMRIGTIVDTLLDADDDFYSGLLQQIPNRLFRFRLKVAIARQLPGLIVSFPDRWLLWRYCMSYTK